MRKTVTIILAIFMAVNISAGELRTAHVFSDGMVLQRETSAPIWGWGEPGAKVSVTGSWDGRTVSSRIADDGSWKVSLETGEAGGPYTVTVKSGKEKLTLTDVMLGEVWICSGQSNMEMPLGGFGFQDVEGGNEAIIDAPRYGEMIRVFHILADTTHVVQNDVDALWARMDSQVASKTSAIANFFARRLSDGLGVPVGIVVNPWGGSRIEPWMSWEAVESAGVSDEEMKEIRALREKAGEWPHSTATCWNGRMAPVAGYAAKGFLWYQGCSNQGQGCYDKLQAAMIRQWREAWGRGDMPFIYALLAPYSNDGHSEERWRPFFLETQINAQELVPACWAVSTETIGNEVTIHPPHKREVADMMYQRALQSVYGIYPGGNVELPRLDTVEYSEDGLVKVTLTQVWSNLMSMSDRKIIGFELAGEDQKWYLAEAEVDWDGSTILVRCEDVPNPVAVRYSYRNWMGANLQTSFGIPVPPFRSDEWYQ